jgi:hypothetical protein
MSLILTYAPRDDESGMGYYRRLSADNALFSWRNLTDTAGVERSRRALLMRTNDVARNLGLEPEWTESARQKEDSAANGGNCIVRNLMPCARRVWPNLLTYGSIGNTLMSPHVRSTKYS